MSAKVDGTVPYLAWGYHAAAVRGEAPREVSTGSIAAWLETRPVSERARRFHKDERQFAWWLSRTAGLVLERLEKIGVVKAS